MYYEAAQRLLRAHEEGESFKPFAASLGVGTLRDAYDFQSAFVTILEKKTKAHAVGYKIGLTSKRMQAMCNIDEPIAGVVLSNRVHQSGETLRLSDYGRLGIEFEIGVRLGIDIHSSNRQILSDDPAAALDGVCAAIELIDDRNADYGKLDVFSLVADNAWNAGIVLGEMSSSRIDLAAIEGTVFCDGQEIDKGFGYEVLGHPLTALAWVSDHLLSRGGHLRKGDVVLTGSLVTTRFPRPGQAFEFRLRDVGTVAISLQD